MSNKMVQYRFKRDTYGKLSDKRDYSKEFLIKTSFKYPKQGRFLFGVAKLRKIDLDKLEGIWMDLINYTGKNIVTIDVYEKHIKTEIDRVKMLKGDTHSHWVIKGRPEGGIWMNDPVSKLAGASGKKGEKLVTAGIATIRELKPVPEDDLSHLKVNTPSISLATLKKWRDQPAHIETYPHHVVDYRKAASPYKEKYGEDE